MPQPEDIQPFEEDVDAHLFKEALAAGVVAGALFAGTAQAKPMSGHPSAAPAAAQARAATVVFEGGTPAQRLQVTKALAASTFDWSLLPSITVHISENPAVEATAGDVYIASSLLDAGRFAWGVVQHEFAHQVDFFLLNDTTRAQFMQQLGGSTWCEDDAGGLKHSDYGCERFASTLAWAYWQNPQNCMKPQNKSDIESNAMTPAAFRALLNAALHSN